MGLRSALRCFPPGRVGTFCWSTSGCKRAREPRRAASPRFQIELDREERIVEIPDELKRILSEDRSLRRWYDELNYSTRNDIDKWITEPKSSEARIRRAEQIAERLLNVMEAERELPPVLQIAFAHHPRAREGWDEMSPSRRRGHLFGIFYYRTPDAQARRIDKMLDDAIAVAEKINRKKRS